MIEVPGRFCDIRDYLNNAHDRIKDEQYLRDVGHCVLMLSLESMIPEQQAAWLPSRVEDVDVSDSGLQTVTYNVLNFALEPIVKMESQIEKGYMHHIGNSMHVDGKGIVRGYFLSHEQNDVDKEWEDWATRDLHRTLVTGTL